MPQPESQTRLQNSIVTVHSYKDGKQRFFIQKDGSSQTNEKGLQIEVPLLREMVEKQPAMRPYFISYSLLDMKDSKDKTQYGNYMLTALTIFLELLECMYLLLNVNSLGPILQLKDRRVIKFLQLVNMKKSRFEKLF